MDLREQISMKFESKYCSFLSRKHKLKISSAKWHPFGLSLNLLRDQTVITSPSQRASVCRCISHMHPIQPAQPTTLFRPVTISAKSYTSDHPQCAPACLEVTRQIDNTPPSGTEKLVGLQNTHVDTIAPVITVIWHGMNGEAAIMEPTGIQCGVQHV